MRGHEAYVLEIAQWRWGLAIGYGCTALTQICAPLSQPQLAAQVQPRMAPVRRQPSVLLELQARAVTTSRAHTAAGTRHQRYQNAHAHIHVS